MTNESQKVRIGKIVHQHAETFGRRYAVGTSEQVEWVLTDVVTGARVFAAGRRSQVVLYAELTGLAIVG